MANIKTVNPQEDFLVQTNGDYNVPFSEVSVTVSAAVKAGTVLESAAAIATIESTTFFGITAQDKPTGTAFVRVLVRGNPTTVNAQALTAYQASLKDEMESVGIVVVND